MTWHRIYSVGDPQLFSTALRGLIPSTGLAGTKGRGDTATADREGDDVGEKEGDGEVEGEEEEVVVVADDEGVDVNVDADLGNDEVFLPFIILVIVSLRCISSCVCVEEKLEEKDTGTGASRDNIKRNSSPRYFSVLK